MVSIEQTHANHLSQVRQNITIQYPREPTGLHGRSIQMTRTSWNDVIKSVDVSRSVSSYASSSSPISQRSSSTLVGDDDDDGPVIFVHDLPVQVGGAGRCYRGRMGIQEVVVKVALSRKENMLIQESLVYEIHGSWLKHPTFYGLYEGEGYLALLLEWRGEALDDFMKLEEEQR